MTIKENALKNFDPLRLKIVCFPKTLKWTQCSRFVKIFTFIFDDCLVDQVVWDTTLTYLKTLQEPFPALYNQSRTIFLNVDIEIKLKMRLLTRRGYRTLKSSVPPYHDIGCCRWCRSYYVELGKLSYSIKFKVCNLSFFLNSALFLKAILNNTWTPYSIVLI